MMRTSPRLASTPTYRTPAKGKTARQGWRVSLSCGKGIAAAQKQSQERRVIVPAAFNACAGLAGRLFARGTHLSAVWLATDCGPWAHCCGRTAATASLSRALAYWCWCCNEAGRGKQRGLPKRPPSDHTARSHSAGSLLWPPTAFLCRLQPRAECAVPEAGAILPIAFLLGNPLCQLTRAPLSAPSHRSISSPTSAGKQCSRCLPPHVRGGNSSS